MRLKSTEILFKTKNILYTVLSDLFRTKTINKFIMRTLHSFKTSVFKMKPDDITLSISPEYTTLRLNQSFITEIEVELSKGVLIRLKRDKIKLILAIGKSEYEIEFTKTRTTRLIQHHSKVGLVNGFQKRDIVLKTINGQVITKKEQLLNIDTSSALKKAIISGGIIGVIAITVFFLQSFYIWFGVTVGVILVAAVTKTKLLTPDNTQMNLLGQIQEEERLTEEHARQLYNQALHVLNEIKQERTEILNSVEDSLKGLNFQLKTIKEVFGDQEQKHETLKTTIDEFKIRFKTVDSNKDRLNELEQNLEKAIDKLSNKFGNKLKSFSESFTNQLKEATIGSSEQEKSNRSALETLQGEISDLKETIQALKETIDNIPLKFDQDLTSLVVTFDEFQKEVLKTTQQKSTEHLSKEDRKLIDDLRVSEKVLNSLEIKLKDTNGRLANLEKEIKTTLADFERYKGTKPPAEKLFNLESSFKTYSNDTQKQIEELTNRFNKFSEVSKQKLESGEELTDSETSQLLRQLNTQITDLETRIHDLSEQHKTTSSVPTDQYITTDEFVAQKETISKDLSELRHTITELQKTFVEEINKLTEKITKNSQKEISSLPSSSNPGKTPPKEAKDSIEKILADLKKEAKS